MKIVQLKCPGCNALIEANSDLNSFVCNYCGSSFLIDDERVRIDFVDGEKTGHDMERGRMRAHNEGADPHIIETVHALIEPLGQYPELMTKQDSLRRSVSSNSKKVNFINSIVFNYVHYVICGIVAFLGILIMCGNGFSLGGVLWTLILSGLSLLGSWLLVKYKRKTFADALEKSAGELRQVVKNLADNQTIIDKYDVEVIPEDYRYREAMTFIYKALKNKRAMSMMQAINLYEEDVYRKEQRRLQERQIEMQQKQVEMQQKQIRISQRSLDMHSRQVDLQQESNDLQRKRRGDFITAGIVAGIGSGIVKGIIRKLTDD